jgi:UDP-glucose 4-epimerase
VVPKSQIFGRSEPILVLGDGFIGSTLKARFKTVAAEDKLLRNLMYAHRQAIASHRALRRSLDELNPSVIINAAGPSSVAESWRNPEVYVREPEQQIESHLKILATLKTPPRYIFISSAAIYGDTGVEGARESSEPNPISPYAIGKLAAEERLRELGSTSDCTWMIARIFSAYSQELLTRLPFDLVRKMKSHQAITLSGDGSETRDFIHTNDICNALEGLITTAKQNLVVNLGTGVALTIREVASIAIKEFSNRELGFRNEFFFSGASRLGDPKNLIADTTIMKEICSPISISPQEGLSEYFRWHAIN